MLHPPYTAWHLSYVVIGAALAPKLDAARLAVTLVAFFAAVGIAAHALDELDGRPLRTHIASTTLKLAAAAGLSIAVALGIVGVVEVGWVLLPFVVVGPVLALAYNLELFGGRVHTDLGFALAWGAFPVITAYVAQTGHIGSAAVVAAGAAVALSYAQRTLSTPARTLRRRVARIHGAMTFDDGRFEPLDAASLLAPLERALRYLAWGIVGLAIAMVAAHVA